MEALASVEQLMARLGVTLSGADLERALAALDDASATVRTFADEDWTDEEGNPEDVPEIIQAVTLACAYRAYSNPSGFFYSSVGDVTVSYGRQGDEGHGGAVYLTKDEKLAIRRSMGRLSSTSVQLESPYGIGINAYYIPVAQGGDPIPIGPFPWEVL